MPTLNLPKGGGSLHSLGEKFGANALFGTAGTTIPLPVSPARSGFGPALSLAYDSAGSSGPFGLGWRVPLPQVTRRTDRGVPKYDDTDTLRLDQDDLVPALDADGRPMVDTTGVPGYRISRYRRQVEGAHSRIERWTRLSDGDVHWRTLSGDNRLAVYGRSPAERISVPADPARVFTWLLSETRDPLGNAVVYEYLPEDDREVDRTQPHEAGGRGRGAGRYLKRVRYGNRVPLLDAAGQRPADLTPAQRAAADWMFEVVFDYGDHDPADPAPAEDRPWHGRRDAFSTYRPGFELRTHRLCRRVLLFHHFPLEPGVGANCLVSALELTYREESLALLTAVTSRGYQRQPAGGRTSGTLPPVRFEYTEATVGDTVRLLDEADLEHVPAGLGTTPYQWVDLYGEGMPGILTEHRNTWYYKQNLGGGAFGPQQVVADRPSTARLAQGRQALLDLSGDGRLDLVALDGRLPGIAEGTDGAGRGAFTPFDTLPKLDFDTDNVQLVDLSGDGRPDLLVTDNNELVWFPSRGARGFGAGLRVTLPADEHRGPRLVRADTGQAVFLADMSGDGLADLVRVRNTEICYWPNLGHGRFGDRVLMSRAPVLDRPDRFDARHVRLADVDGSGSADLVYLGGGTARLWFNEAGNAWRDPVELPSFPHLDDLSPVTVADLLGNGTACLVWSTPATVDAARPLRYLELMAGGPPRLLCGITNSMGAETRIGYAPSTGLQVAARRAGRPWLTRLPFPVHVVARVEAIDHVDGTRLVSRYVYHHGYFDPDEREFRGFALVERFDTESFEDYVSGVRRAGGHQELAPEFYQPPVTTRSWFHTGAFAGGHDLAEGLRAEFHLGRQELAGTDFPPGMTTEEYRECVRALKGLPLREETYSEDGTPAAARPYTIVEHRYALQRVQRGVVAPIGVETLTRQGERDVADARVEHALVLETGRFGQVLAAASVVYGRVRRDPDLPAEVADDQARTHVVCERAEEAPEIDVQAPVPGYRLPTVSQARSYELTGVGRAGELYTVAELRAGLAAAADVDFGAHPAQDAPRRRLLGRTRTLYRGEDLAPLPLGQQHSRGLVFESCRLAFTAPVVATHYADVIGAADWTAAGYRQIDGDWWIPSGTARYPADPAAHFYLPDGARDPFGVETVVGYDRYHLLPVRVALRQAAWHTTSAVNDYRVLRPVELTDPNGNRTAVAYDELGLPVRSAVMGKAGAGEGDTLADPTQRFEYDLTRWADRGLPNVTRVLARERHGPANTAWRESFVYATGAGGVALVKTQAPGGWLATGRTVVDNKGNVVKQYEPYFSPTSEYDDFEALATVGVTPVITYDALGRAIRVDRPDGTCTTVNFDPWRHTAADANDTVLTARWYADRGSPDPAGPEPADPDRRAAWLAARHAGTPSASYLDSLGRPVYAVSRYEDGRTAAVRSRLDLTGRDTTVFDQLGREISSGFTSMTGLAVFGTTAERGSRWAFFDIGGALVRSWDEHGRVFRTAHDALRRPLGLTVEEPGGAPVLLNHVVYGDRHPDAVARNLNGAVHQTFDPAGVTTVDALDFTGTPRLVRRRLAADHTTMPDWQAVAAAPSYPGAQAAAGPLLEPGEFTASATYDALGRPERITLPDSTVLVPAYDRASRLATLSARIGGQGPLRTFLAEQTYNAKGQRLSARHGNDVLLSYGYDPATFRLIDLLVAPEGADPATAALQRLHYTYDPVGNITACTDQAQQTRFFANAVVTPETRYTYDALYQLRTATGRELAAGNDAIRGAADLGAVIPLPHANDTGAVRRYTEHYDYDLAGNLTALRHVAPVTGGSWTRHYRYRYQDDPADGTNRLAATSRPGDPDAGPYTQTYDYDRYGNFSRLFTPTPGEFSWNVLDRLDRVDLGGGGTAHYGYGADGARVRKVVVRPGGLRQERIYLGALEVYRERRGAAEPHLVRHTVHLSDDTGRIAQVDVKVRDTDDVDPATPVGVPVVRYQYGNHLGSAVLETDDTGTVIGYEEYHPFGTTAYRSARSSAGVSLKRYRFAGKERDEETGLYHVGARYYAPWLGRWTSPDPAGFVDGPNLYRFCRNNPVTFGDANGCQAQPRYLPGTAESQLTEHSNHEDRVAFARSHGFRLIDPDPGSARWTGSRWQLGPQARLERITDDSEAAEPGASATGPPVPVPPPGTATPPPSVPASAPAGPATQAGPGRSAIPSAPSGTDFRSEAAAGRWAYRDANQMAPGTQAQHWTKELSAQRTGIHPAVMNANMSALQSRNALPATTLLTDPAGGGTRYSVGGGSTYGNEHKFADRFLIPQIEDQIRQANPNADPREVAVQAGRQARWIMTGAPGPDAPRTPAPAPPRPPLLGPGFAQNVGGGFARAFIPGFVEAEIVGVFAHPFVVGTLGMTSGPLATTAAAISAAPTQFAAAVTLPALGGAVAGNAVESIAGGLGAGREVSIGAAVLAAAGVGAIIGTFVPIPGVGTAAGAAIGAVIGVIGYGLSKLF